MAFETVLFVVTFIYPGAPGTPRADVRRIIKDEKQ